MFSRDSRPRSVRPPTVRPDVRAALAEPGRPLEPETRRSAESSLGHDFSKVRIHDGPRAAESADAVNALAYTVGRDVVFGEEQYRPRDPAGQALLAHELGHVREQEGSAPVLARQPKPATCAKTFSKATSFSAYVDLVRAAEAKLAAAGTTDAADQIEILRGIYYGTTWSADFKVEKSAVRNLGFKGFTGHVFDPMDPSTLFDCGLFAALQQSQDLVDGKRHVDVGHLIIAMDARNSMIGRTTFPGFGGTGVEIVTWLGDLGGGAGMLAVSRGSVPTVNVSTRFSGTDFGGSINLEGDVAGFVVGSGGATTVAAPVKGKKLSDALDDYFTGTAAKPSSQWTDRATNFLKMHGGLFDAAGNLTNGPALQAGFAPQIESFACQYLMARFKDGKITRAALAASVDHVRSASKEVAQTFVDALDDCHKTGNKLEAKRFPSPTPAAPGACSSITTMLKAQAKSEELKKEAADAEKKIEKGAGEVKKQLEKLWPF